MEEIEKESVQKEPKTSRSPIQAFKSIGWYQWLWIGLAIFALLLNYHSDYYMYYDAFQYLLQGISPYLSIGYVYGVGWWLWGWVVIYYPLYDGVTIILGFVNWHYLSSMVTKKQLLFLIVLSFVTDLFAGNCNSLLLLLITIAWKHQKDHPYLAGLLLGYCCLKPAMVLIVPFFVLQKRHIQWTIVFGVAIVVIANYLPVIVLNEVGDWWHSMVNAPISGWWNFLSLIGSYESFVWIVIFQLRKKYPDQIIYKIFFWILAAGITTLFIYVIWMNIVSVSYLFNFAKPPLNNGLF